ncbi:putative N-acetylated-alpha-linked acidic dipeptidase [Paramacrobiotus metropolitanus]|uniref:putative N-acetylated-alpha-linked acidic dipeptidase n=1 Tax=Paramacrobiotus metropolitanus TaxID=2943436 RepID=UPI002445EB14|nr:putative N-acetylated-alpha-linked acidic dipeptidase [Paramacrobiotus metropolitanus]
MQASTKALFAFFALLAAATLIGIGILVGYYGIRHPTDSILPKLPDEEVRQRLFANINSEKIREHLRSLTRKSHPSGTIANDEVAEYIYNSYKNSGLEGVHYANYEVLLSRPNETTPNSVQIVNADGSLLLSLKYCENTSGTFDNSYFAYSPAASVTADTLIYANLARDDDFKRLKQENLNVNGSVIIARYGGFRGDQVKIAAKYGAKAVMLFLDPSAVAPYGINESQVYPNTQWMPGSAMERGSVFLGKGDPQSQGFVSEPYDKLTYRAQSDPNDMPQIPATPIGYEDAQRLFDLMRDSTNRNLPSSWTPSRFMNYAYGGKLSNNRKITLTTTNYEVSKRIRNVIGRIQGCEEPDRYVLLGNHYDAWTMGGIDPNSGTAVLLELARTAGELRKSGFWCPRRTIVFGSWDAEEYGLIGSTEWVEENLQILQERAVAYINVDAAVRGRISFWALSMPLLDKLIYESTKLVPDPHNLLSGVANPSVYDIWANTSGRPESGGIPIMGKVAAGSDYANFVNMVGITSADIRYVGEKSNPAYHTGFETFEYVERHIDPDFKYHVAVGQVWIEIVRALAESDVLPFSIVDLASDMYASWEVLKNNIASQQHPFSHEINLGALSDAVLTFGNYSQNLNTLLVKLKGDGGMLLKNRTLVNEVNNRLMKVERMFVDPSGLPNRPLIRHILQAPAKANAYGSSSFAGIADCVAYANEAMEKGDEGGRNYWINQLKLHYTKVVQMVNRAARFLAVPVNNNHEYTESLSR